MNEHIGLPKAIIYSVVTIWKWTRTTHIRTPTHSRPKKQNKKKQRNREKKSNKLLKIKWQPPKKTFTHLFCPFSWHCQFGWDKLRNESHWTMNNSNIVDLGMSSYWKSFFSTSTVRGITINKLINKIRIFVILSVSTFENEVFFFS